MIQKFNLEGFYDYVSAPKSEQGDLENKVEE